MKKLARLLGAVLVLGLLFCGTAFAGISSDVKIDVTSVDLVSLVEHGIKTDTRITEEKLSSDNTGVGNEFEISFDVTFKEGVTPYLQLNFASTDHKASVDIISSDKTDGVKIMATIAGKTSNDVSFDVSKASKDILLTVHVSDDTNSGDVIVKVTINAKAVKPAFTSAKVPVYAAGKLVDTVTFTSADKAKSVTVSTDVTVSLDLSAASVDLVSVDGKALTGVSSVYSLDITTSSKDVYIYFTSADASFEATLTINVDSSSSATTETYVLNAGAIDFIGSDTAKTTKTVSAKATYATSQDAPANWDAVNFEVSSADIATFTVTVSTDNTIVAAYLASDTTKESVLSGDEIDFSGVAGEYVVVFSADLVLSTDTTQTSDDTAYFSVTVTLTQAKEDTPSGLKKTTADDAATSSDQSGNSIIAGGQTIDTKFLTNGTLTADTVSSFFGSANTIKIDIADDDTLRTLLTAMNLTESAMGNDTDGYKAVALGLPAGVTLNAGDKFFVIITTSLTGEAGSKRAIGIGVLSANQVKTAGYLPIVFNLLRDPTDTNKYMGFDPDEYYVGATNDTASSDSGTTTRVVVVTAAGDFAIQSKEKTLLQGQNATTGAAVPYEDASGDDDDQETSSHGSSSGCDAGFGALALLAVAGALAARKVRK